MSDHWKKVGDVSKPLVEVIAAKLAEQENFSRIARESGVSLGTLFNVRRGGNIHLSVAEKLVPVLFDGQQLTLN